MADVFISYHEESAGELAEQIADALEGVGVSCWCARRDLPFGGDFAREIPSQIAACRLFLLILTESVYQSAHIENEVGIAFSRRNKKENIQIVPLELGDFIRKEWVQYYLIHTQSVKFPARPDEPLIRRLVKRIAKNLNPPFAPQPTAPAAPLKAQTPEPSALTQTQSATPERIIKRGECGDNVSYALDESGLLTISGNGAMRNFEVDDKAKIHNAPWRNERKRIALVTIQRGVTTIGRGAFDECAEMRAVSLPDSVNAIGDCAFADCAGLTSVSIPDSVTAIGDSAFRGCLNLASVSIPDSVTAIGDSAFRDCANLAGVSIPDSVTAIGDSAFRDCANLTGVSLPDSVTSIGYSAFRNCSALTAVSVPGHVISIERFAFRGCSELASVSLPDSLTRIGEAAFMDCVKLTGVSVPAKAAIDNDAFPDSVLVTRRENPPPTPAKMIQRGECGEWGGITYALENGVLTISGHGAMLGYFDFLIFNPPWRDKRKTILSIKIQNGVTSIGASAFKGCVKLTSVSIPYSVTSVARGAFANCVNLTSVDIASEIIFIDEYAFAGCLKLKSVVVPEYADINRYAFPTGVRVTRRE